MKMVAVRVSALVVLASWALNRSTVSAFVGTTLTAKVQSYLSLQAHPKGSEVSRRQVFSTAVSGAVVAAGLLSQTSPAEARLESVNRPDLLPREAGVNVLQTEKFLTSGQAKRMDQLLVALERDTGYRVRVLCQSYPNTPGLAIRDYWDLGKEDQKDDKYVVLVVDQFGGRGNVLNFNVGDGVKIALPNGMSGLVGVVVDVPLIVAHTVPLHTATQSFGPDFLPSTAPRSLYETMELTWPSPMQSSRL
jgi:hypothetical protein